MAGEEIFFEQIRSAGCSSYMLGCAKEKVCVVIDPELDKADDYAGLAEFLKAKLLYAIDTHTHADHNSACKVMRERFGIKVVMHRASDAPYIDLQVEDGEEIHSGNNRLKVDLHAWAYPGRHVPVVQGSDFYRRYTFDRRLRTHRSARRKRRMRNIKACRSSRRLATRHPRVSRP